MHAHAQLEVPHASVCVFLPAEMQPPRRWQREFLIVTTTRYARHHLVCQVGHAFYRDFRQVVVTDQASYCNGITFELGLRSEPDRSGRAVAWAVTPLTFPANAVASLRLANETAASLGWAWRWMLVADDDCIVSPTRELARALKALRSRTPWYLGTLDSMWWNPNARGPTLSPVAIRGLGSEPAIVQPEDRLQIGHGTRNAKEVNAVDLFPSCAFPEPDLPPSGAESCDPQPAADALAGCWWKSVTDGCPALWRNDKNESVISSGSMEATRAPFGYGMSMTALYGNGMAISRGMLRIVGAVPWQECERDTPQAIAQTGKWLASGSSRVAASASDWHLSRCMFSTSLHYPTLLPRRFNRTFTHHRDHGHLHARVMAALRRESGLRLAVDADGYAQ